MAQGVLAIGAPLFTDVFGQNAKDIGSLVKGFDFDKINIREDTTSNYLHADLAPAYGKLNKAALNEMDDQLKIMIAGTLKELGKQTNKSWNSVLGAMMWNPLLEPDGQDVARADRLIKNSAGDFKTDGSADPAIVREVQTWFANLISDDDVLQSTKMDDITVLGNIVARTGATVDSFEAFFAKSEHHEQTIVDVGVLRFPELDHPYFKLFRIKLTAWSDSTRILFHQEDKNGISGEFNSRRFKPRQSVMDNLTSVARIKAIEMANSLFDE